VSQGNEENKCVFGGYFPSERAAAFKADQIVAIGASTLKKFNFPNEQKKFRKPRGWGVVRYTIFFFISIGRKFAKNTFSGIEVFFPRI